MASEVPSRRFLHRRAVIDLSILAGGAVLFFLLLALTPLHEDLDEAVGDLSFFDLHLDEFLLLFIILGIAFALFSLRRMRELNYEIDAHVNLEKALRESEQKFRSLSDSATEAVISINAEGKIVYWNKAAGAIYGYGEDEIIGKNVSQLMPARLRDMYLEQIAQASTEGLSPDAPRMEIAAVRKNGEEFLAEMSLSSYETVGQRFFTAMIRDVTEIRAAEEELAFSEAKYRAMVDHIPNAVVLYNPDGILFANPSALELLGAADELDVVGKSAMLFVDPDSREIVKERMQYQLRTMQPAVPVEERFVRLDGTTVDVEVTAVPIMFKGNPVIQVIAQDITERKAAQIQLEQSERRYRALVETARDVIFTVDLETGTITNLNPVFEQYTGWKVQDWLGKQFGLIIHPDDLQKSIDVIDQILADYQPASFELRILTATGYITLEFNIEAIRDDGRVTGILGIARDISDRKRSDEQLRIQRQELEEKSEELEALYRVASTVNQNLKLGDLLNQSLYTISRLKILSLERAGGIMLVKGDRMELIAHLGHADSFLREHEHITIYDCLCGLAARTGEMVVSDDSGCDIRHTIRYPGMKSHGHVIVPLKAHNKVLGVMYFYVPANAAVTKRQQNTLKAIGEQMGLAIANAQLYEDAEKLSLHDALTGLANRNLMKEDLTKCMARAKRSHEPFSLIMLDLDHFKRYNDTHGHTAGDRLLTSIGAIISREVREVDMPVRFGGEEFLVILPDTAGAAAAEVAERIRRAVLETNFGDAGHPPLHITISAGVAEWNKDVLHRDEMITLADGALYEAKRQGRNQVIISVVEQDRCYWVGKGSRTRND